MICQVCGNNPAVVHLEELRENNRVHLWLCMECAEKRKKQPNDSLGGGALPPGEDNRDFPSDVSLPSFFDLILEGEQSSDGSRKHCPSCGFSLDQLGRTNRLGCPGCYDFFRAFLVPILARLHRHSSHMGKGPRRALGEIGSKGEIARRRVALEKAILAESFEEAARLRDLIIRLETQSGKGEDRRGDE